MRYLILTMFSIFLFSITSFAHGEIHESIKRVTKQINKNPNDPNLYLERGQYYKIDQDFDKAFNDYMTARTLDPEIKEIDLLCGRLFSEHNYPLTAKRYADKFLSYNPKHVAGLMLRASIYVQLGEDALAVIDYETGIKQTTTPKPEYFVDISRASLAADSTDFESAIGWLEKGEEYLGFNIILKSYAYDLAKEMKQYQKAVEITESVLPKMNRKETWLFKKAVVLELAKDLENAKNVYNETIDHIKKLPRRIQKNKMMLELEANTKLALMRLN